MSTIKFFDSSKSQSKMLPVIFVIGILLSSTTILATRNITGFLVFNESNEPKIESIPVETSPEEPVSESVPLPEETLLEEIQERENPSGTNVTDVEEPVAEETFTETFESINIMLPEVNQTNETDTTQLVEENSTVNESVSTIETNETTEVIIEELPSEEETPPVDEVPAVISSTEESPNLEVTVEYPDKVTRGESLIIKATVTNTGSAKAKKVLLTWQFPDNFALLSGDQENKCSNLEIGDSCTSEITVGTAFSTELGRNEVKVVVNYEA